jgi:hypothetical protein
VGASCAGAGAALRARSTPARPRNGRIEELQLVSRRV